MKKMNKSSSKDKNEPLKDCNCLNCRLGRIEDQLNQVQHALESLTLPSNPGRNPGNNPGKSSKKNKKRSK